MPDRLDVDLASLYLSGGVVRDEAPLGLLAQTPSRKAARIRDKDLLFVGLALKARQAVPPERYTELLDLAATTFFNSPGSVTAALRQALVDVNQTLLAANLREPAIPLQGGLLCAALRGEELYAVQCGPGLLIVAHENTLERFPPTSARALGVSKSLEVQYFHTTVRPGDYFVVCNQPPTGWSETALAGLGGLATLSLIQKRLEETAGGEVTALIGRFESPAANASVPRMMPSTSALTAGLRAGLSGLVKTRSTTSEPTPASAPHPVPTPTPTPEVQNAPAETNTDWSSLMRRAERLGQAEPTKESVTPTPPPVQPPPAEAPLPVIEQIEEAEPTEPMMEKARQGWRSVGRATGVTLTETIQGLRRILARMLPEGMWQKDGLFTVPTSVMVSIAVLIPVLVVALAVMIYVQRGRAEQFAETLRKAQFEVQFGRLAADPLEARPHWEGALEQLNVADQLQPNDDQVAALKFEAQSQLDEMDWVTRLDYQPLVLGGVDVKAQLRQLVLIGQDVYALDTAQNRVWHIMPNTSGIYVVDRAFECASGSYGEFTISTLIDMARLPMPNAMGVEALAVLDTAGGLLYCAPGEKPLATYLPSPDTGWIRPTALEVYADRLYVLDPGGNEVWQFLTASSGFDAPAHYFTGAAYHLGEVIDFSIAQGDLFLLHKDGHVMHCTRVASGEPTTCIEAVQYLDQRLGRQPGERLSDVTQPTRLLFDPPPEPSLYLIDQKTAGVYQFSLKLMLVRQFRPRYPLKAPVTNVAIDPSKRLFLTAGDNVYFAARP